MNYYQEALSRFARGEAPAYTDCPYHGPAHKAIVACDDCDGKGCETCQQTGKMIACLLCYPDLEET